MRGDRTRKRERAVCVDNVDDDGERRWQRRMDTEKERGKEKYLRERRGMVRE